MTPQTLLTNASEKSPSRWVVLRLAAYTLVVAAVVEGIVLIQGRFPGTNILFREGHAIEWTQVGLLMTSSFVLFGASGKFPQSRELYRLLALLPWLAVIRELDSVFDNGIGRGAWGTTCAVAALGCGILAFRWRRFLKAQFRALADQRSFGYLASAVLLVLVLSRIIGQKIFWKTYLTQEKYTRDIPRAVEELGELSGYLLLLCGVLDLYFDRDRRRP